uniref:Cytochrome P450 n=1 Tax=Erpetoichthys calabaricus TaxID=27687 RepID=A0A8C4RBF9_ERPCA
MELFGTLVLATIVLAMLFLLFRMDSSRNANMPPGPTPLPIVGNLLQHIKIMFFLLSAPQLKDTYGPVMTVHLGSMRAVVLVGFEAVHEALVQQADVFAGRGVSPLTMKLTGDFGLIQSNGERWKQIRRFSLSTMRDFGMGKRSIEEWIQEEAKHLTEEFRKTKGSPCDPTIFLSRAVSNVICSIVFGQRFDYQDKKFINLVSLVNENLRLIEYFLLYIDSPRDFIDSFLIKMKQEDKNPATEFHHDNLNITVLNLFSAGTETTSTTLRYGLLILMKYPHIQEKVQKEIDMVIGRDRAPAMEDRRKMPYTDAVLHEIQRFIDLVPLNGFHKTTKDTIFRGYTIPADTVVIPVLYSVLFDKTKWATPHSFNPGHFLDENGCFKMNSAFMPFSTGKRICAGEGLAKMELFLFFTTLLQNFSFRSTEDPANISLLPDSKSFFKRPLPYTFLAIPR